MKDGNGYQILPPLSDKQLEELKVSIKADGVIYPILVDEDGKIIDGNHRHKLDPHAPRKKLTGYKNDLEKQAAAFKFNMARRHLNNDQAKELDAEKKRIARELRELDPKHYTQQRVAELFGVGRKTVDYWLDAIPRDTKSTTNGGAANGCTPCDARVSVPKRRRPEIAKACKTKTQQQVAMDFGVTQQAVAKVCKQQERERQAKREQRRQQAEAAKLVGDDDYGIYHGDFRKFAKGIKTGTVDLIFTDPPYNRKALPLYGDLAEVAARVLKPGGSLVTYCGMVNLCDVLAIMSGHGKLRYFWICALLHNEDKMMMRELGIKVCWKPLLWFVKGSNRCDPNAVVKDVFTQSKKDKQHHKWGQGEPEAEYFIKHLTPARGMVFDPFCGGATTCVAAQRLGRSWLASEKDERHAIRARARIKGLMEV